MAKRKNAPGSASCTAAVANADPCSAKKIRKDTPRRTKRARKSSSTEPKSTCMAEQSTGSSLDHQHPNIADMEEDVGTHSDGAGRDNYNVTTNVLRFLELTGAWGREQSRNKNVYDDAFALLLGGSNDSSESRGESEDDGKGREHLLHSTVSTLLEYISGGEEEDNAESVKTSTHKTSEVNVDHKSTPISKIDVAKLLLPWAVKGILRFISTSSFASSIDASRSALDWVTLEACLDNLSREKERASSSSNIDGSILSTLLNQSILNKLVPEAAKIAFASASSGGGGGGGRSNSDEGESNSRNRTMLDRAKAAAGSYRVLVSLHRPTMDAACNSLLVFIDKLVVNVASENTEEKRDPSRIGDGIELRYEFQVSVVDSTLNLICRLQRGGVANPKKVFALFSSPATLSALARLYSISINKSHVDDGTGTQEKHLASTNTRELVKNILWRGLFHPIHHIEGFRSMHFAVSALVDKKAYDNEAENNIGQRRKRKKCSRDTPCASVEEPVGTEQGKKMACYQERLAANLCAMIQGTVDKDTQDEKTSDEGLVRGECTVAAAIILPLVIQGFVHQTRQWREDHDCEVRGARFGGKRSSKADVTLLQFRFWSCLIEPLIVRLKEKGSTSEEFNSGAGEELLLLRSIRKCLTLLVQNGLYLPSYPDPGRLNFAYLNVISNLLLTRAYYFENGSSSMTVDEKKCEVLKSLRFLLETNHHLLHNNLQRLLHVAAECLPQAKSNTFTSYDEVNLDAATVVLSSQHQLGRAVICDAVTTYRKLRQLDYLFSSLLPKDKEELEGPSLSCLALYDCTILERIMKDKAVTDVLIQSVQNCPQGQIRLIWMSFDVWVTDHIKTGQEVPVKQGYDHTMEHVIGAFSLFLRSLRIDKHNAFEIKQLCEDSMAKSISSLVSIDANKKLCSQSTLVKHGIALCGWIVDIHTRCSFWLDLSFDDIASCSLLTDGTRSAHSGAILSFLLQTAKDYGKRDISSIDASLISALQRLACHRIEQLHSMIHQKDQVENVASHLRHGSELGGSIVMIAEAKLLVNFAIVTATVSDLEQGGGAAGAGWAVLARTLSLWAPYSKKDHVDDFLRWMLTSLVLSEIDLANDPEKRYQSLVASSIIRDASFYENLEVAGSLLHAGISLVIELVKAAISKEARVSSRTECKGSTSFDVNKFLTSSAQSNLPADSTRQPLTPDFVVKVYENVKEGSFPPRALPTIVESSEIARALRLLRFINGLPNDLVSLAGCDHRYLELLLRLDALAQALLHSSSKGRVQNEMVLSFASSCKAAMARSLRVLTDSDAFLSPDSLRGILNRTYESYGEICGFHSTATVRPSEYVLHSGKVVEELFSMALQCFGRNSSLLHSFSQVVDKITLHDANEGIAVNFSAKVYFLGSITSRINALEIGLLRSRCSASRRRAEDLFFDAAFYNSKMWRTLVDYITEDDHAARSNMLFPKATRLFSDLVRYAASRNNTSNAHNKAIKAEVLQSLDKVFALLGKAAVAAESDSPSAASLRLSFYYLVAAMPELCSRNVESTNAPKEVLVILKLYFEASHGQADPLLDAAFCGIVQNIDHLKTRMLLSFLIDDLQKTTYTSRYSDIASTIHAYHLILVASKGQEQKSEVATVAKQFISLTLQLFCPNSRCAQSGSMWSCQVQIGTQFLVSAVGKKNIVHFSSQDAALILTCTMSLLAPMPTKDKADAREDSVVVSTDTFCSCCAVLSALLKFYPKQLYSAAPSVISVTQSLLSLALASDETASKMSGDDRVAKLSSEFAKVTELLSSHKEVFKKHVVGLILFFVESMESGMTAATKKHMLPAIFSLLDMCTKHEMHQIQVTMTPTSKSLFRSVFTGYQKLQYKGQY